MFSELLYTTAFPLIGQLTAPEGFWVHAHVNSARRFAGAYRDIQGYFESEF